MLGSPGLPSNQPDHVVILTGAGHMAMYEDPEGVAEWVMGLVGALHARSLATPQKQQTNSYFSSQRFVSASAQRLSMSKK